MPHWSDPIISNSVDRISEILRFQLVCEEGLRFLWFKPRLMEQLLPAWRQLNPSFTPEQEERMLGGVSGLAAFAAEETKGDFAVLAAHSIVALWGALEALVEDLVVAGLRANPSFLEDKRFASLKIRFSEFQALDEEEKLYWLLKEHSRNLNVDRELGISRFEALLDTVKMSGPFDAEAGRCFSSCRKCGTRLCTVPIEQIAGSSRCAPG